MKKVWTIACALLMVVTLAACANQSKKTDGKSKDTASSKVAVDYRHKTTKYLFQKNGKDYTADFPQLSEEASNYQKANDLLKSTAMQTINAMGTTQTDAKMTAKVKSKLTNYDNQFISATFEETTSISAPAKSSKAFRTVNFDLKKGTALTTPDLIVQNDALNTTLLEAAKKQVSAKLKPSVTADVIKTGMQSCSIYFEHAKVGFSIKVPSTLGDHIEIELKYEDVKPFITKNAIWNTFGKL
jgi:hypothetical protein